MVPASMAAKPIPSARNRMVIEAHRIPSLTACVSALQGPELGNRGQASAEEDSDGEAGIAKHMGGD